MELLKKNPAEYTRRILENTKPILERMAVYIYKWIPETSSLKIAREDTSEGISGLLSRGIPRKISPWISGGITGEIHWKPMDKFRQQSRQ